MSEENTDNGFRTGKKEELLETIKAKLTNEEAQRIAEWHEAAKVAKGTRAFALFVYTDGIRISVKTKQSTVDKCIQEMMALRNQIARYNQQILSGVAFEELSPGIPMNSDELAQRIRASKWLLKAQIFQIATTLRELRSLVGYHDFEMNVIMSEDEYEAYVKETESEIAKLGYELFG